MSWFKKAKDKIKIGVGTALLAIAGAAGAYFTYEIIDYRHNVIEHNRSIGVAVFVGDTGQPGPHRDNVNRSISRLCPDHVFITGDISYPTGPNNADLFQRDVVGPYGDMCPGHKATILVNGNHEALNVVQKGRAWLAKNIFPKRNVGKVWFPNYYHASVFTDACVLSLETSVYEVLIGDPDIQKRQEKFAKKFLEDERCIGKRMIAMAHHPIFSSGTHGDSTRGEFIKFYRETLMGRVKYYVAGHDHNLSVERCEGGTCHFVSGAGSKLRHCVDEGEHCVAAPGYFIFENGVFKMEVVR